MKMRTLRHRISLRVLLKAKHLDTLQHGENTPDFGEPIIMLWLWWTARDSGEPIAPPLGFVEAFWSNRAETDAA